MKILEIETFGRGGLTHYAFNLSRALADRGHDVTLVTTVGYELADGVAARGDTPPPFTVLQKLARTTGGLGDSRPGRVLRLARRVEAVTDAVRAAVLARRMRPDLIHLHCTNPVAALYLALLRLSGRPVVYTAHVVTPHEPVPFEGPLYWAIHRLSHLIVAHSEVDRQRLIEEFAVESARLIVIPHGEYSFFQTGLNRPDRDRSREELGLEPQHEVALFFGYVREYKGLDVLLDAWPSVSKERPTARLVVAGDPVQLSAERRAELEARATGLGALVRFEYIPFDAVASYFAAADVLVMPYRRISQSGVLLAGLALGLPVLATKVGPWPEMLDDGESAVLVAPDSSSELGGALVRVLGDPRLRRRLVEGGRRVARQHSWERVAEDTERAFLRHVPVGRAKS